MELLKVKKGFEDSFFFIIVIFTIAIFILILHKVWTDINPSIAEGINSALPTNSSVNVTNTFAKITSTTTLLDKLIPFILIGLFAFVLIGAAAYMQHPIMAFVGIIILGVAVLLAVIYANVYNEISSSDSFSASNSQFPIMELVMKNLPIMIIIAFVGITIAVLWSRNSGGSAL